MNEVVKNAMTNEYYGQYAPSQANRTNFTPGKKSATPQDMNWPTEFRPPIAGRGNEKLLFERNFKIGRMSIADSDLAEPIIVGEKKNGGDWIAE